MALDLGASLGKAGNHSAIALERFGVAISVFQHHRRHSRFKAVALRAVACVQTQSLHWYNVRTVQGHQAMCRAHKAHAAPARQFAAGFQLVAHDLGDG